MTATNETTTTTKGTAQLRTTTSGCLKADTGGTPAGEGHPTGNRSQTGRTPISRDLFIASTATSMTPPDDDFQAGFRTLDHDDRVGASAAPSAAAGGGHIQSQSSGTAAAAAQSSAALHRTAAAIGSFTGEAVSSSAAGRSDITRRSYERMENEISTSIIDAPFSPIPSARLGTNLQPDRENSANSSTPIRGQNAKHSPYQLNTSTPVIHLGSRSGKSSRNSWAMDCSTPNTNSSAQPLSAATGNGSRYESRRSHDRSFGNNTNTSRQTSSPCLGDFITHSSLKSKSRKSTTASANNSKDTSNKANSIFLDNDFPGLQTSMQSSTPGNEQHQPNRSKKRVTPITVSKTLTSRLGASSFELENSVGSPEGKSKRRIAPTILSRSTSSRHDFNSSSFKSDNNLINLTEDSLELDLSQKDERGLLRNYKDIIKSNFESAEEQNPDSTRKLHAALRNTINTPRKLSESTNLPPIRIDLSRVTKPAAIDRLVAVYSLLIDLNLTPNILSELSYLINLINTEFDPFDSIAAVENGEADQQNLLKNLNNCVYFALEVLNRQKTLLALLDSTTLKVLIENERIAGLNQPLHLYLREIHGQKLQLDSNGQRLLDASAKLSNVSFGSNVLYQQEADTKEHFPSDKEFGAFKKQRDAFCTIYRTWDFKHLNPTWNFLAELGGKVRSLLGIMEHPINMAHLAKLFTAQLVQSCNFDNATSELAMDLPNVDPAKLVKLRQRLVAPGQFSTQYLFPGSQAFFRDFIIASESNQTFIEQLKAVLIHELLEMNGSSYEVLNVSSSDKQHDCEYVVRPESTTTMRVLAKFIGYIISRPFGYDSYRNSTVDNRQIQLRNTLLPLFDVKSILLSAIAERKLIITVPWLVQYLAMLDGISLRLSYYKDLFDVLYELYLRTNAYEMESERRLLVTPTSKFIIRACLGWLFEHPNIPEEYLSYRRERRSLLSVDENPHNYKKIELLVEKTTADEMEINKALILTKVDEHSGGILKCEIKPAKDMCNEPLELVKVNATTSKSEELLLNPLLENILNAACPFLADFRVSMMPSKVEKTVSRSGRYRHITTKYSGTSTIAAQQKPTNNQHRLIEAFLQSQSLSVRRTVEFVIERASSAAIKDFQVAHLLPERKKITEQIATIQAESIPQATKQIYMICSAALADINARWDEKIPPMLARRIKDGFDALLPSEALESVKRTCINLALERCLAKTSEWRQTHMLEIDLFCKDIPGEASKAVKNPFDKQSFPVTPLLVTLGRVEHTFVYEQLQTMIYLACSHPDELSPEGLNKFLVLVLTYLDEQDTIQSMNRTLAYMLLQLALLIVIHRCDLIVPEIVQMLLSVWQHRKLSEFCVAPESSNHVNEDDEIAKLMLANSDASIDAERSVVDEEDIMRIRERKQQEDANYIFSTLVSNRCIRMMDARGADDVFACFANLINSLVDCNLISIRLLNEQFVKIFNESWQQQTLERVSWLMDAVLRGSNQRPSAQGHPGGRKSTDADDSHSQLFLEMLSDLARGIGDF
ncbi:protein disks lost [Armigeres subalbatus]|uniref:protein disks lost n=1 Tax=Armigeres subalbatus TaxID=124917 RepID=UPI002ED6A4D9